MTTTEESGESSNAGTSSDSGSSSAEMSGTGVAVINILIYAQEHEKVAYRQLIDEFTQAHADQIKTINFEVTTQDEYGTKMTASMTANDMPDIFYIGPESVRSYVDNGYALALNDYVDQAAVDNLWPAIKSAYMYDG